MKMQIDQCKIDGKNLSYKSVPKDFDGWVDASKFLPVNFDILFLKLKNKSKIYHGWFTGKDWDGLRLDSNDEILFWKRKPEEKFE